MRQPKEILLEIRNIQPVMRGTDTYQQTFERLKKLSELQVELCESICDKLDIEVYT